MSKRGRTNYFSVIVAANDIDLDETGLFVGAPGAGGLFQDLDDSLLFDTADGIGLLKEPVISMKPEGEADNNGKKEYKCTVDFVAVGVEDPVKYDEMKALNGKQKFIYFIDQKLGLVKKARNITVDFGEEGKGNAKETFTFHAEETGDYDDLYQRKILPLTIQ